MRRKSHTSSISPIFRASECKQCLAPTAKVTNASRTLSLPLQLFPEVAETRAGHKTSTCARVTSFAMAAVRDLDRETGGGDTYTLTEQLLLKRKHMFVG